MTEELQRSFSSWVPPEKFMIRAEEMHPVAQKSGRSISLVTSRVFLIVEEWHR
jgi:hypothetical protein